ncbi:MAG: TIGR03067 domain-containing protein, partial [Planctomycetota bacterium]
MHFLWQGCLVALVTVPADWLLRHAPASRRYALHVTALTIMVVCVAVTFFQIELPVSESAMSAELGAIMPVNDVIPPNPGAVDRADLSQALPPSFIGVEATLPELPSVAASTEPVVPQNVRDDQPIVNGDGRREFQRWAPQIAMFYFACCALLLARLVRGTWSANRLRKAATTVSEDSVIAMLHRQSKQLRLRVMPRVAWCAEVSIPLVIGIFKPMILLPAAAATGLSPDQLQALITHELAHIYRYDLLVNLLQRIVESMLFFHPAVWYISRRISSEREHACDEMVLATGCERLRYADALVRMAELSTSLRRPGQSAPATSLAAAGTNSSEFKRRVLKVLSVPTSSQLRPSRIAMLVILTFILGAALFASRLHFSALAETPPAPTETETIPPAGLEFLKPYPNLHGLSLDMTESQFLEIIKQQDLKSRKTAETGKVTHRITLGDDHTLIVMFDRDGKCGGIQRVRGEDEVADERVSVLTKPQGKESQLLFQKWQRTARISGDIPGGAIGPLVRVMTNFVKNNPTHEGSPKLAELLKWIDVTRDWSHDEAVKLLDDVAAIYPSLPEWVEDEPRFTLGGDVVVGKPLPVDLKDAPWGEAQPNGLRAAWLLEPRGNEHRLNTPLKSRVLFHNTGKNAVVFRALTWNQSGGHKALDAQGKEININSTWWTTIPRTFVCRLAPGEFIEVIGAGIGVGPNKDDEDWRDARSEVRVGSWIEAKAGDDVTFTPATVDADGREAARPDDDESPSAPKSWWLKFIKDRLSLDAPLPADANERGRLLDRAVHDLFGNAPTNDELAEFKNDTTPGALDALAKRLAERTDFETFSEMLTSGPTKFKVLPVDPDAAKKPHTAKGPGRYPLGGNVTFAVTRRPIGERIVNEARLDFAPTDPKQPAPRESHPVPLPDGYDTWIAAWMRGGTVLWITQIAADQKKSIRRYDFTNPVSVLETVITELKPGETLPETILDVFSAHFRLRGEDNNGAGRDPKPGKYAATLPNGVEVELAGVAMANVLYADQSKRRKEDGWWRANGTRLQAPPMELFSASVDELQKGFREFAIKLTGDATAITASHVSWTPHPQNGSYGQGGWDTPAGTPGFLKLQHSAGFNDEKPVAVHVFVSDLPFGPAWLIDGNGLALPQKPADAKTESLRKLIHIVGVEKKANETIFRSKRLTAHLDQRLEINLRAIDKRDQSHASSESRGSEAGEGRVFKLAAADIKHFEIRLRPMTQMVTFENISLVPGQVTDVKVKIEAVDPLAPQQAIASDQQESADLKKMVEDLAILLPEHWHPRHIGGRTIQMMPGSYLNAEDSPHVVLVFTNDKTRPIMKWDRKDGQYEYLGETPHGHGHLFVSMKITGNAANPETMKLFDWPDAAEFVKAYLKGDHARITAIRKRPRISSTISRNALASGSDAEVGTEPDASASRLKTSQHFTRNGLRYELEAVAFASLDQPGGAKRKNNVWWRADGTKLDSTPANLTAITVPKGQANFREFVLRAHVVDGQEIRRHSAGEFWVPSSPGQWLRTSRLPGPDVLKFQLMKKIDVEKPATFALYFTDEPWSLSATLDLNGKLQPNAELDANYLALVQQFEVRIVEKLPTTTIVKVHPTSDDARRTLVALSAIKLDGQTKRATEPTTDELYVINAPASEIDAFQVSLRKMTHKATFENVATLPGQKTEPKVSLEPLDTLVRVTFRKDGKTVGILSDMSVTQLEETLAVLQHDLNSEASELIIDTHLATTFAETERIVKRLKASGWKWPTITVTSPPKSEKDIAAKNVVVKDFEPLQGNWAFDICDSETKDFGASQDVVRNWRWTAQKNEIKWTRSNGEIWNLSFAVDSTKSPKEIDFTFLDGPHKGEKCLGMFEWGGVNRKMLQISLQDPGAKVARPKSISMTGGGQTSLIFLQPIGTNEAEKELASFQGTWCFDVLQIADWPQPIGIGTDSNGRKSEKRMVVKGNQISWTDRQGNAIVAEFTIDPFQTPKQIDFTFLSGPNRGAMSIGIYEPQRGNAAYRWLCMTHPGSDAPRPIDVSASSLKKQSMIGMYQVAPPEKLSNARALERFQGVWNMTLCDSALPTFGATQPEASKWQWTISGDEVLWNRQGEVWNLKLDVDPSKRPREINLTYLSGPFQGEKCMGIYEFGGVDEQSFNISIQDPGANVPRPKAIEMRGGGKTSLIFLRPAKPSDAERQIGAFQGIWTLRNFDTSKNNESTSWPLPKGKGPDKSGEGSELRWVVKGNEITWLSRDGQEIKASFTLDPVKRPKQIDLTFLSGPDKGETCPGIYQRGDLDENILWLCMADPKSKSVRPKNFSYRFSEGRSVLSLYPFNTDGSDRERADNPPKPQSGSVSSTVTGAKPTGDDASRQIPKRDKYSATLPNGDEVELVSVAYAVASHADGNRKRKEVEWWRADGTKLDGTPPFKLSDVWVNADQADFREFAFRLKRSDDIVPLTTLVSWTPRPNRGSGGATGSDAGIVNLQHVAGFKDQTPVNVHFFYSNLPTQGAGVIDIEGKMPPLPQPDSGSTLRKVESLRKLIQIVGVEKNKDETILRFQMPPYHSELMDVNFVAIDINGNVHGADRWHNTPVGKGNVFRLPAAEISHFDIRLKLMTHKITFENVSLAPGQKTDVTVKVEPIPEGKSGKLPTDTAEISEMEKTVGLEFLKLYPKLQAISLDMTESQFLEIARQQELKPRKSIDGDKVTHHISLGDGHTLIVMFDKDAKCSGIQRMRSEEAKQHAVEVRLVGGPRSEPLPKVKVEFTSGHGSDQKSFGTFTTDDAGWIRATLPVGFYYLHLSSELERPYLTFEKFWTGNGQ